MAEQQSQQHRLPQVPAVAAHSHRRRHHGSLSRRFRRRVLSKHLLDVGLPIRYVLGYGCAYWLHHICLRRHG